MTNPFRYKNIFLYASLQFCGNIEEYFSKHTEKLVVFIVMPRIRNKNNVLRLYQQGKLIEEKKVTLSENIFLYYFLWYITYWKAILHYFSGNEKIHVISFHPLSFFFMTIQKFFRKLTYVFWIGDYFPPVNMSLRMYEQLKKFYHDQCPYACYLGDGINEKMNGKVVETTNKKTIMWGLLPHTIHHTMPTKNFCILFIGLVKPGQGMEYIFDFLKLHKDMSVYILGVCNPELYQKFQKTIKESKIVAQVFFPNKFFSDEEIEKIAKTCNVGIALYDEDKNNLTYYTDPGKVKTYTSLGLPVIMSNVSSVKEYIKKFKAGELVKRDSASIETAIQKIKKNYQQYLQGVEKFNEYFHYETYYKEKFTFLEKKLY